MTKEERMKLAYERLGEPKQKSELYKEWVEKNYERRLELNREWYSRNKEYKRKKNREYYQRKKNLII